MYLALQTAKTSAYLLGFAASFTVSITGLTVIACCATASSQQITQLALNILSHLFTKGWICANSSYFCAVGVVQYPLVPLLLQVALVVTAVVITVMAAKMAVKSAVSFLKEEKGRLVSKRALSGMSYRLTRKSTGEEQIYLQITRANQNAHPKDCLKLVVDAIRHSRNLPRCRVNVSYGQFELAIDAGGPSREFFDELVRSILVEPQQNALQFQEDDAGTYNLTDSGRALGEEEKKLCQNIGILFGAMLAGFNEQEGYKLGTLFPPRFFAGLICLYNQRHLANRELSLQEKQQAFSLAMAQTSPGQPLFGLRLHQLSSCHEWIEPHKLELKRFLLAASTEDPNDMALINSFDASLNDRAGRERLVEIVNQSIFEDYQQYYQPICLILEGIEAIPSSSNKMRRFCRAADQRLTQTTGQLACFIQGEPYSRQKLLSRIHIPNLNPNPDLDLDPENVHLIDVENLQAQIAADQEVRERAERILIAIISSGEITPDLEASMTERDRRYFALRRRIDVLYPPGEQQENARGDFLAELNSIFYTNNDYITIRRDLTLVDPGNQAMLTTLDEAYPVNQARYEVLQNRLGLDPAAPAPMLPPVPDAAPLPNLEPLRWIYQWLEDVSEEGASNEQCIAFLKYTTGLSTCNKTIRLTINQNPGFTAHTCSAHLEVPNAPDKATLIAELKEILAAPSSFNAS